MLILATAANDTYLPRIAPYLHTIERNGQAFDRRVLVTVGCKVEMPAELGSIEAIPLPADRALGHTGIWCVQQGCHLEVLDAADDDVVIFTDGDIQLQRGPNEDELAWMRAIPRDTFALGWNAGPHDTLAHEAHRLALSGEGRALFQDALTAPIYNCGVMITRVASYRALYQEYLKLYPSYLPHTIHYAATQFLLCAIIARQGWRVWQLPYSVHTHGCFGVPEGVEEGGDASLWVDGAPVLFRHHWMC